MTTMTGREVLRAIADGADPSEFEYPIAGDCDTLWRGVSVIALRDSPAQYRRKPKTRTINGFTVPAPETVATDVGAWYYLADPTSDYWCHHLHLIFNAGAEQRWLSRGLIFLTKEAAIANARAMCGIDPNTKEQA